MIIKKPWGALVVGKVSLGCKLCWKGAKEVIFITGLCNLSCPYCPISTKRAGKDQAWANERPIRKWGDMLVEAREMKALGASITGGDPLTNEKTIARTVKAIRILKDNFGERFHIHLYTNGYNATPKVVKRLEKAGLDEIRFDLLGPKKEERLKPALETSMDVTIEVPGMHLEPWRSEILGLIDLARKLDIDYFNVNELEFSDTNWKALEALGFERENEIEPQAKGSRGFGLELALKALESGINFHFCPAREKHEVQYKRRMARRAKNIRKPWQWVTEDGLLAMYVLEGDKKLLRKLAKNYKLAEFNAKFGWLEGRRDIIESLAEKYYLRPAYVELMPIYKPWIVEKIYLD